MIDTPGEEFDQQDDTDNRERQSGHRIGVRHKSADDSG